MPNGAHYDYRVFSFTEQHSETAAKRTEECIASMGSEGWEVFQIDNNVVTVTAQPAPYSDFNQPIPAPGSTILVAQHHATVTVRKLIS